jgi:hypothetical protein
VVNVRLRDEYFNAWFEYGRGRQAPAIFMGLKHA